MSLPNDVARCQGVSEPEGWRAGCEDCRRRTDHGTGDHVAHMMPPPMVAFCYEYRIEPGVSA